MPNATSTERSLDVFISHSSQDAALAGFVVDLLRSALTLRAERIRCTSVDGYRLPAGTDTDEQLRDEALSARVFIGILSAFSMASAYVLFELGARWGAKKPIIPLLAPGTGPQALRGPLTGLNAVSCESSSQLHQLVADVASALDAATEPAAVYQRHVDAIVYSAHVEPAVPIRDSSELTASSAPAPQGLRRPSVAASAKAAEDEYADAEQIIARHCEREWPDDYSMRSYCIEQQREAVNNLRPGGPDDIPSEVFRQIRRKCAREWPDDFSMRHYSEQQQIAGYRQVRGGRK